MWTWLMRIVRIHTMNIITSPVEVGSSNPNEHFLRGGKKRNQVEQTNNISVNIDIAKEISMSIENGIGLQRSQIPDTRHVRSKCVVEGPRLLQSLAIDRPRLSFPLARTTRQRVV